MVFMGVDIAMHPPGNLNVFWASCRLSNDRCFSCEFGEGWDPCAFSNEECSFAVVGTNLDSCVLSKVGFLSLISASCTLSNDGSSSFGDVWVPCRALSSFVDVWAPCGGLTSDGAILSIGLDDGNSSLDLVSYPCFSSF